MLERKQERPSAEPVSHIRVFCGKDETQEASPLNYLLYQEGATGVHRTGSSELDAYSRGIPRFSELRM